MSETIFTSHTIETYGASTKQQTDKYYHNEELILEVNDSYFFPTKNDFVKINDKKYLIQSVCINPIELIQEFTLIKINENKTKSDLLIEINKLKKRYL